MKNLFILLLLATWAGGLKAQTLTSPNLNDKQADNTFNNYFKSKPDTSLFKYLPELSKRIARNANDNTLISYAAVDKVPFVANSFPDKMPVANVVADDKMPVAKLQSNDRIPVLKFHNNTLKLRQYPANIDSAATRK